MRNGPATGPTSSRPNRPRKTRGAAAETKRGRGESRSLPGPNVLFVTTAPSDKGAKTHRNTPRSHLEGVNVMVGKSEHVYSKRTIFIFIPH